MDRNLLNKGKLIAALYKLAGERKFDAIRDKHLKRDGTANIAQLSLTAKRELAKKGYETS